jgi:uncharacterized membrane protein YhaH (DUF805 family)
VGWALRLGIPRTDLGLFALGAFVLALTLAASTRLGEPLALTLLVLLAIFGAVVLAFVAVPHVAVASMIPLFALLPAVKALSVPWIGPLKDVITVAAICAAAITVVQAARGGRRIPGDLWIAALVGFLLALYAINVGGGLERGWAWFHGVRLFSEPMLLLLVGMTLKNPRRTLRWSMVSLVATACFVSLVGILQQIAGPARLVDFGYLYDINVRTINGFLRSFGTLDEPFAYAAFLIFGFCAVVMWMPRGRLAYAAGILITIGLAVSVVRSAAIIGVAVIALLLARHGRMVSAIFLLAIVLVASLTFVLSEEATERRVVQGGPSLFITLNGRTDAWKVVFSDPSDIPMGRGVGKVGTANDRATYKVTRTRQEAEQGSKALVVDSGYFVTMADIGIVGLAALLILLGRLVLLARRAVARGRPEGWLALAIVLSLALDAVTRESFTAFPTAFLGLLLTGLALAAASDEPETAEAGARPARKDPALRSRPRPAYGLGGPGARGA